MKLQTTSIALAAIALFAAAPAVIPSTAQAAPTVAFQAPAAGATISQTTTCEVTGQRIQRVSFSIRPEAGGAWTALGVDQSTPWRCSIDPSQFPNGQYLLRAIAYDQDSGGASDYVTRTIKISNSANAAPKVSFKTPSSGKQLPAGGGLSSCEVSATDGNGIQKVEFFMNGTLYKTDTGAAYTCTFSAGRFPNGSYTLKAVATDKAGAKGSAQISLTIGGGTASNNAPSVSITKPDANATISAPLSGSGCQASAADSDGSVKRVDFFLSKSGTSTPVGSKTAAPYQCAINPADFASGSYTLMAVATDDKGAVTSAQRGLSISTPPSGGGGGTSPINPAHILTRATADAPFSQQDGYTAQVINTYTSANDIAESGIHGTRLPNGETMRFGKTVDPTNSTLKALVFQVKNTDPTTSAGKRSELSIHPNIEMNKVYWITFSAYVYDWGTLGANDSALFGTQIHTGDNQAGVGGPSVGIYTTQNGRMLRVHSRYSESSNPTASNVVKLTYPEHPIPFHRWTDFVVKVKHNTSGNGLLQVWMDGEVIANYRGSLGYNTGKTDYAKFGYYNWSGSAMGSNPRKVLLRSPTIVADPTGSTYSAEQVRTLLDAAH